MDECKGNSNLEYSKMTVGIYIINFNNYDNFNSLDNKEDGIIYKYYTDSNKIIEGFDMINLDYKKIDELPNKASRYYKCKSHLVFPDEDYSIYIDASFKIVLTDIKAFIKSLGDFDIAQFRHPKRNCLFEEINALLGMNRFEKEYKKINKQYLDYKDAGFPFNYGLFSAGFIIRKNNNKVRQFNNLWWDEVLKGSYRDQASEMFCIWKVNLKMRFIDGNIWNNEVIKFNNGKD